MGYKISYSSKIGVGTIFSTRTVLINKAKIGMFNMYTGEFDLTIDEGANIGSLNEFTCSSGNVGYCKIGKKVHITRKHFFDTSGGLTINDYTRIAGCGSQFWTHGGQRERTEIVIDKKCYVGSGVKFSQGVKISENSFVGMGSVVVDMFDESGVLILGHPAKIVKKNIIARKSLVDNVS